MNTKTIYGAIAITFIVAVLALFIGSQNHSVAHNSVGAVATSTTNLTSIGLASIQVGTNCDTNNLNSCLGVTTTGSSGVCSTASTTLFAIQNPFAASSTVQFASITGTQGATTTDIVIATSTTAFSGLDGSNTFASALKGNFISLSGVATSSGFHGVAGGKNAPYQATTTNNAGVTVVNNANIVVGPSEFLIGYSTSSVAGSANGSIASGLRPIPSSCVYDVQWVR